MNKQILLAILLATLALSGLWAQTGPQKGIGVIIYAEGDEISVYRANTLSTYAVSTGTVQGLQLEGGDLVQTGPGTFVEIQLLPSQSVLKIAENTSFRLTGVNTPGGSTIDVIYGRVKARVDPLLGKGGFAIRGKTSVAAVRGTEFGYDIVAIPGIGQEPSAQIYSFGGTVSVYPLQPEDMAADAANRVFELDSFKNRKAWDVKAGQMVVVYDTPDEASKSRLGKAVKDPSDSDGRRSVVVSPEMKPSVRNYWKGHADKGTAYDEESLQAKFYGIKISKPAEPEASPAPTGQPGPAPTAGTVPAAKNEVPSAAKSSLADAIEPIGTIKAIDTISPNQYALVNDNLKLTGIILGSVGLAGNLLGAAFSNFGTDMGLSRTDSQNSGIITYSVAGAMVLSGLICYIIGLFE